MANVEFKAVGHALVQGARGAAGGAPSKDSVWGVAVVSGVTVVFYGRRNGTLSFQTVKKADVEATMEKFGRKVAATDGKDYAYADVTANYAATIEGLAERVGKGYHAAKQAKKLNLVRRTKKVEA